MKHLTSINDFKKNLNKKEKIVLEGVFVKFDTINRGGLIYPDLNKLLKTKK